MTGLCGWVGTSLSGPAEATMATMGRGLPPVAGQVDQSFLRPEASVLARGWSDAVYLHHDADLIATLAGEPEWSDPELSALAEQHGHGYALAAAYRKYKNNLFSVLHGPFSLAVLCPTQRTALLGIDRMGVHGICYATAPGGGLVFGTTTDAVNGHPAMSATVTPQTVFNFLQFYHCPAPTTIYGELSKLPLAHYLIFDGSLARPISYWDMPYREHTADDPRALTEELHSRLRKAIRKVADPANFARTGAFLSGGLDSSAVCGLFSELSDQPAKSFTIAFDDPRYDESDYARICARHFGLDHEIYTLSLDDAASFIPQLAAAYDEPFGNSSAIPTFYCAKMAAENGVTHLLAGDGGDELFAGNERYVEQNVFEYYSRLPGALRRNFLSPMIRAAGHFDQINLLRRAANYVKTADKPLPLRLFSRHPFVCEEIADLFSRDALGEIETTVRDQILSDGYDAVSTASRVQRMMRLDLQITLADNDLRKVGRMCELAGCRVRFPLLDEGVVEFAAQIPTKMLLEDGRLRRFYKNAMTGFLPDEILTKSKHGFGMPFDSWTQQSSAIQELVCDSLSSLAMRGIFNPATIHELVDAHRANRPSPWRDLVWDMMMLELWWQSRAGMCLTRPDTLADMSAAVS